MKKVQVRKPRKITFRKPVNYHHEVINCAKFIRLIRSLSSDSNPYYSYTVVDRKTNALANLLNLRNNLDDELETTLNDSIDKAFLRDRKPRKLVGKK